MSLGTIRRNSTGILFVWLLLQIVPMHAESANKLYKRGVAAEQRGDLETAFTDYGLALDKEPTDIRYKVAQGRIRTAAATVHVRLGEKLRKDNHFKEALVEFFRALDIDPGDAIAEQEIQRTRAEIESRAQGQMADGGASAEDLDRPGPPERLDALPTEPITLNMTEDSRVLYETVAKIAGLSVLVDPESISKRVTLNVRNVTPREALDLLGKLSNSFWIPATHNTIYVAQNTRTKRQQIEEEAIKTFYLSNISQPSDLNDIVTTLRNVSPNVRLFGVPGQNAIVVRGTPDEILVAKQLIASLDLPKPEVLVDVYVMEVSRTLVRAMGISPPTSLSVTENSNTTTNSDGSTSTANSTLNQIGRSSSYSYTIGQAQAEMMLTDTDTRVLQNPRVRAVDSQKATLNIGQRIPIATGSFTTPTTTTSSSVQTQFQYIDVGVNVELTPTIHADRDVTMKIHVEVSSQTGTDTISGVAEPVISQEKAEQVVRMKDGEVSIMAGLMQNELQHVVAGWPGLGELPGIKYMFSTQQTTKTTDELVFMLVPHVVREFDGDAGAAREFSTGSNDSMQINRIPAALPKPMLQRSSAPDR
jgi:general secretion pathway protein D